MAEARHPVMEQYPPGGAGPLKSTLSKSPLEAKTPSTPTGESGHTHQKEAISDICEEQSGIPTLSDADCSSLKVSRGPPEQSHQPGLTETHTPSHHHEVVVNATNGDSGAAESSAEQSVKSASLPVHRSHSDILPPAKQGVDPQAPDSDTCGLACHEGDIHGAESHSMLACKQSMQLQQCNVVTTMCRGGSSGEGGVQLPQGRCVCISSAKAAIKVECPEEDAHHPANCDQALCYSSYIHHANFEDTFAAYCHPQPIPAPSQLLPRLAGLEPTHNTQRAAPPPSAANHLTLPRLISSVSETGLDAKHLLRCCNLNCTWISGLPPGAAPPSQKHLSREECCSSPAGQVRVVTRDTGTMTAHKVLRDVGVQTAQTISSHVYPQICLADESRSETSHTKAPKSDSVRGKKHGGAPKSPVKEVKWDAEGMTWEVYGASVDPEELGLAIQRHLELQIKETASRAAKLSRQNTSTSQQPGTQRKRSRMMGSFRTPGCCSRSTTAVD